MLGAATDVDDGTLAFVANSIATSDRGTAVLTADGGIQYTPGPDLNGPDAFTYRLADAAGEEATVTVTVDVGARAQGGACLLGAALACVHRI